VCNVHCTVHIYLCGESGATFHGTFIFGPFLPCLILDFRKIIKIDENKVVGPQNILSLFQRREILKH